MKKQKQIILKLDGDLQQGIKVFLEIKGKNQQTVQETTATLSSNPQLNRSFQTWSHHYRQALNLPRIKASKKSIPTNVSIQNFQQQCQTSADHLIKTFNQWLNSDSIRNLCNLCLQQLKPEDHIKIIIRTDDIQLRRLPWQQWHLWENYLHVEFIFGSPQAQIKTKTTRQKARILVILGNQENIDVEQDKQYLQQLCPNAELVILNEPTRQEFDEQLWSSIGWDLLFFSGHSHTKDAQGIINLNSDDSLSLQELRYGLKIALDKGLQLGIFNSCDGLGVATELEQLQIPNVIVMKEPVADKIAQTFLKYFLAEFTAGTSLETSVGTARKKLLAWEKDYPCASWLPVLIQNPLATSPTWQSLNLGTASPYKGLSAFREKDTVYFFGREELTLQLVEKVKRESFIGLLGASGSGKSSLVFAGLIPSLKQQQDCQWQIISFRPTDNPFQSLAISLINFINGESIVNGETKRLKELELETNLKSHPQALREFLEAGVITPTNIDNDRIYEYVPQKTLLVIDQFEELYSLCDGEQRQLFLHSLLEVINWTPLLTTIVTLRADFYQSVLSYRPLSDAFQDTIVNVSSMNQQELSDVINKPAQLNQVAIEQGLTQTLIDSVIDEAGSLPLLEFTLTQLWKQQTAQGLTFEIYKKIGSVEKALANHAELFYAQLTKPEREIVKRIFLQLVLVSLGDDSPATRRLATKAEIAFP